MQWRRTGPTLALFLIGLALLPAGLAVGLAGEGVRGAGRLADALPLAGLVLMACAAALAAAGRTPVMAELRAVCWIFLTLLLLGPLLATAATLSVVEQPLVLGVLLVGGLSVSVCLALSPSRSRRRPRPFTGGFGLVLTGGLATGGIATLLIVLSGAVSLLVAPGVLLAAASALFLTAPAALVAARRIESVAPGRWLATAYLAAVYLLPFVVSLVLAELSWDGLAVWLVTLLVGLLTLAAAAVAVTTLAYDSALRRRRSRSVSP